MTLPAGSLNPVMGRNEVDIWWIYGGEQGDVTISGVGANVFRFRRLELRRIRVPTYETRLVWLSKFWETSNRSSTSRMDQWLSGLK